MNQQFSIPTALCLPVSDIEALIQGRTIAALPQIFIRPGQRFILYPADSTVSIKAWAKCELCQILDETKPLDILSKLTIWTPQTLKEIIRQQQHLFLAYLRVYKLPLLPEILVNTNVSEKIGKFVSASNFPTVSESSPILSDRIFAQRKRQLENLEPPQHPELEELQSALASLTSFNSAAKELDDDIKVFLGWSSDQLIKQAEPNLTWINDIANFGNRSIELEEKKSNYQAGTDFENIARQSLEFLGFKVENAYKGGAGGLDLFCSKPYPIVCECKAGRLIPSGTVEELIKLGGMHLGADQFLDSAKLVIGPGNPSADILKASQKWKVSIINAMTLQKLVELKAQYPGAVNLVELQQYLEPGQIDYKIAEFIDKTEIQIKLRSQIIKAVKELSEQSSGNSTAKHQSFIVTEIRVHYNATNKSHQTDEAVHDLLIELSSPLTGYLGREKGENWRSDRFYFLRDLATNLK
ncbi:DUF1802 family protein [Fortiea contorta]|uniref:DUF1802 family protein n=1 Tax=Fortiea contorta TaxID=1892405 RepID=UPI000348A33A|nr:DUF1802 family protein [Fortiea contorta]